MRLKVQSAPSQTKIFSGLLVAAALMFSQSAWAAGTASGTVITNSATLNYSVATVAQTPIVSDGDPTPGVQTTNFTVDNKVNLTVVKQEAARVNATNGQVAATPLPAAPAFLSFVVTNSGNTTQDFKLSAANPEAGATDPFGTPVTNFATSGCRIFLEANANTTLQIGTDTEVSYINNLAPDGTQRVYLVCDTPLTATNGQKGVADLIAEAVDQGGSSGSPSSPYTAAQLTAANNQNGVEIVAADLAGTYAADDVARDVKASDRHTYVILTASLAVTKTVTPICDPFNGNSSPKNIPGAAVQYAITIVNSGGASATLTSIADVLEVANLTFNTDLISGAGVGANCVSGTGPLSGSGFGAVKGTGTSTSYTAPGVATQATTAGATFTSPNIAVNFSTLATSAIPPGTASTLNGGDFITIYFNAFVK